MEILFAQILEFSSIRLNTTKTGKISSITTHKLSSCNRKYLWAERQTPSPKKTIQGVTLVELLLVIAILGILLMISIPSYREYMDNNDIALAKADITVIANCIERFYTARDRYPTDLNEGGCEQDDPWGNPYEYFNISTAKGKGKLRKDKNLNPINSQYDLYSKGKDGLSVSPLTAKHSRDDIVRANDGGFVGLATDF